MTVSGKVLVVITDWHNKCPVVDVFVQSANGGEYASECLSEDVHTHVFLSPMSVMSKRQMALPEGSSVRLLLSCSIHYSRSWEGEWDSDMEVHSVRTLREQLPTRKLRKRWKLWEKQQAKKKEAQDFITKLKAINLDLG